MTPTQISGTRSSGWPSTTSMPRSPRTSGRTTVRCRLTFHWLPTRQPIVLDLWRLQPPVRPVRFSTILSWNHYAEPFRYRDTLFWGKQHELMKVLDLPRLTGSRFELALSGDGPRDDLRRHGWGVHSAESVSSSPQEYQQYIESSGAEFSVAKDIYTTTRSGWFSERTACYLASGRPAVVQGHGFTRSILKARAHAFRDLDEAADAIRSVEADFEHECEQARRLAERYFDAVSASAHRLAHRGEALIHCRRVRANARAR